MIIILIEEVTRQTEASSLSTHRETTLELQCTGALFYDDDPELLRLMLRCMSVQDWLFIGISMSTLCEWQNRFSEFSEALKKGREVADILVENAMFKRAVGYEYEEVTTEIRKVPYIGKDGKTHEREEKHVKKTKADTTL